jgi:D-alanyl-D-alanine carboxypeptidase
VFISPARRAAAHALVLAVIGGLAVGGGFAPRPSAELRIASAQASLASEQQTAASAQEAPPQVVAPPMLPLSPPADVVPKPGARTQGADQTTATAFNPRLGLPRWLHTTRDTSLWSDAGDPLEPLVAGQSYLRPLGGVTDTRVDVYSPIDGKQGWVDVSAVEPSGIAPWVATPQAVGAALAPSAADLPEPPRKSGDASAPNVSALYVAVIDDDSGQLLYSEQPHVSVPQASTTKIATTLVALERAPDLSRRISVSVSASAMVARDGSSTLGIEPGHTIGLDTLLYGMMLPSGNDAAEQVAISLADSREQFIGWMNDEAAAIGLADTHFANPSGMDARGHYSSAYDMAMLARYAMRNPTFRTLAGTSRYVSDNFSMHNLNRLLDLYPGADGVKIGYTDLAQKTIVASAVRDGHRVFVSLMHSADLVTDSIALFEWVWDNYTWPGQSAV